LSVATSLAGVSVAGTLFDRPTTPSWATRSIFGLRAAWSGVLPPSNSCGSSAQPSGMMMAYFMMFSRRGAARGLARSAKPQATYGLIRHRIIDARRRHAVEPVYVRQRGAEVAKQGRVRHDHERDDHVLLLLQRFVLDD